VRYSFGQKTLDDGDGDGDGDGDKEACACSVLINRDLTARRLNKDLKPLGFSVASLLRSLLATSPASQVSRGCHRRP